MSRDEEPIEDIAEPTDPPEVIEALRSLAMPVARREPEPIYIWDNVNERAVRVTGPTAQRLRDRLMR